MFRYDPATGATPLYRESTAADVNAWWTVGSSNELTIYTLHTPLSEDQISRVVAELNAAGGFDNIAVNAAGEQKADLVISEVTVIPV